MDSILDSDFDIDNPQIQRGDYHARITSFNGGGVEVLMKVVRPMSQAQFAESWENHFPVSLAPKPEKSESEIEDEKLANSRRAVSHAKRTTRYLVQQLQADRLLTLTYRENVEDREKVKADFVRFVRLVKSGWKGQGGLKDWRYVAVLERQERGAYHVHIAVRGWQPITFIRACWYKALGASIASRGSETPGAVNVTPPRDSMGSRRKKEWASVRLASYIVKYMQKTFDETTTEKNRYWRSRDIQAPHVYRHWLAATNFEDALNELLSHLSFAEQFELRRHWGSEDGCCYWCQGVAT
jgi:hypothetical protein